MTLKAAIFHSLKQLEQQIPETWSIYGNCPICRQRLSAGGTPKEATWVCFCQTPCGILTYQLKAKENNLVYYKQEMLLTGLQTWWNFQEDSRASLQWYQSWTQSNPQEVEILISIELKRYTIACTTLMSLALFVSMCTFWLVQYILWLVHLFSAFHPTATIFPLLRLLVPLLLLSKFLYWTHT